MIRQYTIQYIMIYYHLICHCKVCCVTYNIPTKTNTYISHTQVFNSIFSKPVKFYLKCCYNKIFQRKKFKVASWKCNLGRGRWKNYAQI